MVLISASTLVLGFAAFASAHFDIKYPGTRGREEDTHSQWPCGGFNTVSNSRSKWPLGGAPIQILTTHTSGSLQVVMAMGNEPGVNFNTVLVPTFQLIGPQNFCFGNVTIPGGLNVTEGTNATVQVISGGGLALYACVDVTFTAATLTSSEYTQNCVNSTGQEVRAISGNTNANGTKVESEQGHDSHSNHTEASTATGVTATPTATPGAAIHITIDSGLFATVMMAACVLAL